MKVEISILNFIFLMGIITISQSINATPIILNFEGGLSTRDITRINGEWTDTIYHKKKLPTVVGKGERYWNITGKIVINDEVLPQYSGRKRSGGYKILSYDINFGSLFSISRKNPTEIFWVSPDSSLYLDGISFGGGYGSWLDSGDFFSDYFTGFNIIDESNDIRIDAGSGIYVAGFRMYTKVSSWEHSVHVETPTPIKLMFISILLLIFFRKINNKCKK